MENASHLWALPFWILGVPLILAIVEKIRTPKHAHTTLGQPGRAPAYAAR